MPQRSRHSSSLDRLSRKVFETTGFPISVLVKLFVISVIAIVGIRLTVLYTNAEPTGEISEQEALDSKRLTSEEQFIVVSELPKDFGEKLLAEKIGILESKTEAGETLARSGGHYSERATDQLVLIYGTLSRLQDLAGLDSQKSYDRLAEIRQQALAVGNEKRVASADFFRALAVTSRLKRHNQRTDFRFATEAILNLRRKNLVNVNEIKQLYSEAIKLHNTSSQQDNTAVFLTVLGDKLLDSPVREISDLGLDLKDHSNYALYYEAIDEQPYSTQESKLQFFKELFAKIEKAPPQSPETYEVVTQLIDKLVNKSDAPFAGTLTKRLGRAASMMSPKIKSDVDLAINNIETRIASLGRTLDLSGSKADGSPLELPNGKPTTIVFWQFGDKKSMDHIELIANSETFNSREANVLMAGLVPLDEKQLTTAEGIISKYTILDNATSSRLGADIGVDLLPYHVSLDKNGNVISLGKSTD